MRGVKYLTGQLGFFYVLHIIFSLGSRTSVSVSERGTMLLGLVSRIVPLMVQPVTEYMYVILKIFQQQCFNYINIHRAYC